MKGCLGWTCAFVIFYVLWAVCLLIGEANKISPVSVLLLIILGIAVIGVVALLILNYKITIAERKLDEKRSICREISFKYLNAYRDFCNENRIRGELSEEDVKKILAISEKDWESQEIECIERIEQKNRIACEQKIHADEIKKKYPDGYEIWRNGNEFEIDSFIINSEKIIAKLDTQSKVAKEYEQWEKDQADFAQKCYELSKIHMPNFGRYKYNVDFEKYDINREKKKGEYTIWEFFADSYCLDGRLDYTYFQGYKEKAELIPYIKDCRKMYNSSIYDNVVKTVKAIQEYYDDDITVYCNLNKDGWERKKIRMHMLALCKKLNRRHIDMLTTLYCEPKDNIWQVKKRIVVFDIATNNEELKKFCKKIIKENESIKPLITYITLSKEFDTEEMQELINTKNQEMREAENKRKIEEQEKASLSNCVKSWDFHSKGFYYKYILNYYPTTCDFAANEDEWSDRWTVWNFKNTPGRINQSGHQEALDYVIPILSDILFDTFGENKLKYLTLVCIPASTQEKYLNRYKQFAEILCVKTGMINAFDYISVVADSEEKKKGGSGILMNNLSIDSEFFRGKYIVLFDDVITKGESTLRMKGKMENLGATVVGALFIGKTKHERELNDN